MNIRHLLKKVEIDRTVIFGILTKVWGVFGGLVTALIMLNKFTPELQGYFYTFMSILALQGFVDLGIGTAVIQFASHEWSQLSFDKGGKIVGNKDSLSRLISLARISLKWFSIASIIGIIGLSAGGIILFSNSTGSTVSWKIPWIVLCFLTGINICLVPIWSLLEGCNQINKVYYYRFLQGVFSSISVWLSILFGAKLWTGVISTFVVIIFAVFFIYKDYGSFFKKLFYSTPGGKRINWLTEIFPLQWRIALSVISGYFVYYFFTPVLFRYHGAVISGQMGMTWSLISYAGMFSTCWLFPRVPQFGILIAQKKFKELDFLFWRITRIIFIFTFTGALLLWLAVYFLNEIKHPFAARILPPLPLGLFLISQFFNVSTYPFSFYLRAHKKEPLIYVSICFALFVALSNLTLGKYYSATGMAIGYLISNIFLVPSVILIWKKCREKWHSDITPIVIEQIASAGIE